MASISPVHLLLLTTCILLSLTQLSTASPPTVTLHSQNGDVREGDQRVTLSCVIDDAPDDYETVFIRQKQSGTMEIIFMNERVRHEHSEKFSVAKRSDHWYTLTLWNVSRTDTGKYACKVAVPTGSTTTKFVASATISLNVLYVPAATRSPYCSILDRHPDLRRIPGDMIQMQCISQSGNPTVSIKWVLNGKPWIYLNARVSYPSTEAGLAVSELDVTLLEGDNGAIFTCILTSPGFPTFSRNCSVGPFILPTAASPRPPPFLTHQGIDGYVTVSPTRNSSVGESFGPSKSDIMDSVGLPILVGVPATLMAIFIIIIIIFVVAKRRQQTENTEHKHRESQAHLIRAPQELRRESSHSNTIQHVLSPNGGALYAVVQKGGTLAAAAATANTREVDINDNPDVLTITAKRKTLPVIPKAASKPVKSYPPPPAYPTTHEQANLNKIIDNKSETATHSYTAHNLDTYKHTPSPMVGSSTEGDNRINELRNPLPMNHEYATLNEVAPPGSDDDDEDIAPCVPLPRPQISNAPGLYKTVKLF